jgi:casein kinase I homolog HRR25
VFRVALLRFNTSSRRTGTVFYGVHTIAGKEVAIKLEPAVEKQHSPLKHESKIYKTLMGGPGVPWIIWSGKQGDYNVMVIDLLGPSLEDLFKLCNRHFSLKTVLLLADQLVGYLFFFSLRNPSLPVPCRPWSFTSRFRFIEVAR